MLNRGRKLSSIVLALLLLCTTVLINSPQKAFAVESQPKIVGERVDLREENVRAYQLDNGQIQCDIYPVDIFYRDVDGKLKDIDNTITETSRIDNYTFTNTSNSWHAYFKDYINEENAVKIEKGKYALEFNLIGTNGSIVQKSNTILNPTCDFEKTLAEDNRAVIYKNAFENVDVAYTVFTSALKEDIILRDKSAITTFQFYLKTEGLNLLNEQGRTIFVDEYGNEVFAINPMYMEDANGKYSDAVNYMISKDVGGYIITVTADKDFINAPDTVLPVRIDPSYDTTGTNYTSDTFVANRDDSTIDRTDDNYYLNTYLRTGKDTTYGVRRSYLRFKLPSGYYGITSATLKLKSYSKGSGTSQIAVYESGTFYDDYWRSNAITWDTQPDELDWGHFQDFAYYSGGWYSADVYDHIVYIYQNWELNIGFMLKDVNENNTNVWDTLYSSDASSNWPVLSITANGIVTTYGYFDGSWPSGVSDDLTLHIDTSTVNSTYVSAFQSIATLWNGINSNVNIDSVTASSGSGDGYYIRVVGVYNMAPDHFAETGNYNSSNNIDWNGNWVYSKIEVPRETTHIPYGYDSDILKEIFVHEIGHSIGGLWDLEDTTCLMEEGIKYLYPIITSHDRQTLNNKY